MRQVADLYRVLKQQVQVYLRFEYKYEYKIL